LFPGSGGGWKWLSGPEFSARHSMVYCGKECRSFLGDISLGKIALKEFDFPCLNNPDYVRVLATIKSWTYSPFKFGSLNWQKFISFLR
jgi:hypothetical protein